MIKVLTKNIIFIYIHIYIFFLNCSNSKVNMNNNNIGLTNFMFQSSELATRRGFNNLDNLEKNDNYLVICINLINLLKL